jgi:flagellar hook-associated protein 3 FlgL
VALRNTLGVADSTLSGMQDTLAGIQEQVVQAGNGTLSASDLKAIADVLQADSDQLLAQVNATDGTGRHLFAGQKPEVPPFVQNGTEITYQGSQSEQVVQVDAGRAIAIGADGQALLPADLPADAPSGTVSKNLFGRLADTISVLQDASATPQQRSDALKLLGSALNATRDAVSRRQTVVGTNLDELDRLDSMASSRDLQNSQTLASLQDLDYNQALSDLSRQQLILQASQKTFQQISSLSLFNYLS